MDPIFRTAALASGEKIINAALEYDPASRIALGELAPQILAIRLLTPEIKIPEINIFVAPTALGIQLLGQCEADITTRIEGTLPALMSLIKSDRLNLKDSGVSIVGSTHFLAELQTIFKNLELDWEEILSNLFGDIIGHQGANLIRTKLAWAKDRAHNLQRLTSDFLTEEFNILPGKPELTFFNTQVDDIKLGVDRIEARIEQLLARIDRRSAP